MNIFVVSFRPTIFPESNIRCLAPNWMENNKPFDGSFKIHDWEEFHTFGWKNDGNKSWLLKYSSSGKVEKLQTHIIWNIDGTWSAIFNKKDFESGVDFEQHDEQRGIAGVFQCYRWSIGFQKRMARNLHKTSPFTSDDVLYWFVFVWCPLEILRLRIRFLVLLERDSWAREYFSDFYYHFLPLPFLARRRRKGHLVM